MTKVERAFLSPPLILVLSSLAAAEPPAVNEPRAPTRLAAAQVADLSRLAGMLHGGDPFSHQEVVILGLFEIGAPIAPIEADVVISRALSDHDAGRVLSPRQQELLDAYRRFAAALRRDNRERKMAVLAEEATAERVRPSRPMVPPSNDDCAGAEVIPGSGPFPYLTSLTADITDATATGDPPAPSCQSSVSRSIWYTFTPTTSATYVISSRADAPAGSTVDDDVMAIYTSAGACSGAFTEIPTGSTDGCDDDSCTTEDLQAVIGTNLSAGTTYYIVVWKFGATAPTAGNTAVQLRVARFAPPANDTCAGATTLLLNTPASGTTVAANDDDELSDAACFAGIGQSSSTAMGRDAVFSFTAPSAASYSFKLRTSGAGDPVLFVADAPCPSGPSPQVVTTCLGAANRNSGTIGEEVMCLALAAAQQVFVFVDDNGATSGYPFTIEVNPCNQETEPEGTPATASAFVCGKEGSIAPAGDADFYAMGTFAAGARLFAMVDGVAANDGDLDMRVTTATDTLEYDDANGDTAFGNLAPTCAGTPLTGVPTYLRLNHFSAGTASEPYRLYAVVQPPMAFATEETEPNDTLTQANAAPNNYFSGSLTAPAPSTDVDTFRFTAAANEPIFLSLDADPLRDATPFSPKLALLDAAGAVLISVNDNDDPVSSTPPSRGTLTGSTPKSPAESLVFRARTSGTYYVQVTIGTTSAASLGAGDYLLSISKDCAACPIITVSAATLPSGTVGRAYSQTLTATGGTEPYTFAKTVGALPAGLSLTATGTLTGTPTTSGSFSFTVMATDASGCTGNQAYTLLIPSCLRITLSPASPLPGYLINAPYSQAITASGGTAPYSFVVSSGALPPGLTLSAAGLLSGTPTAAGTYAFAISATDAASCQGTTNYVLRTCGGIVLDARLYAGAFGPYGPGGQYRIVEAPLTSTMVGTLSSCCCSLPPGSAEIEWDAFSGAAFAESIELLTDPPAIGWPIDVNTGAPVGPCVPTWQGVFFTALEAVGGIWYGAFCPFSQGLAAFTTFDPFTGSWDEITHSTGTLMISGLAYDPAAGIMYGLTGTPGFPAQSSDLLTIDSTGTATVIGPTGFDGGGLQFGVSGTLYAGGINAFGGQLFSIDTATGLGTPLGMVADRNDWVAGLTLAPGPVTMAVGNKGIAYSPYTITASGGVPAYTFAITAGALPPGMTLGAATGTITGTPTAEGVFAYTVTATDVNACTGSRAYSITINSSVQEASPAGDLLATRGAGSVVNVSYTAACGATDHVVYWGTSPIAGALAWSNSACGLGTGGSASFDPGTPAAGTFLYFVVVGQNGTQEGSYGQSSRGAEEPEAVGMRTCDEPQILGGICP